MKKIFIVYGHYNDVEEKKQSFNEENILSALLKIPIYFKNC